MLTIEDPAGIRSMSACIPSIGPVALVASVRFQSASDTSPSRVRIVMPALFTNPWQAPCSRRNQSANAFHWLSSVTSSSRMVSRSSGAVRTRSAPITVAPASAAATEIAAPSPWAAPVTTITRSRRFIAP